MLNIKLKNLIFGANLIAMCLFLSQINNWFPYLKKLKMFLVFSNYWVFWHFPLIMIGFLFNFKKTLFFLFFYILLDCFFYSLPAYSNQNYFLIIMKNLSQENYFYLGMWFYGSFLPILSYAIQPLLKHTSYPLIIFSFLLIICQSFFRTINGYLYYLDNIKNLLIHKDNSFYQNLYFYIKDSNFKLFFTLYIFNLIPIITSHILNMILFIFFKKAFFRVHNIINTHL
ncbi:MAG: hypothetical protein Q8784_01960 [Vigna little leaf phytoplasma]|nr:hypothetical protein [Vigna little leaf phytoplasma]